MAQLKLTTGLSAPTPPTGKITLYAKSSDKSVYYKDDTGAETPVGAGAMGNGSLRFRLSSNTTVDVSPDFQYLVRGPFIVEAGSAITVEAGGQLAVL